MLKRIVGKRTKGGWVGGSISITLRTLVDEGWEESLLGPKKKSSSPSAIRKATFLAYSDDHGGMDCPTVPRLFLRLGDRRGAALPPLDPRLASKFRYTLNARLHFP